MYRPGQDVSTGFAVDFSVGLTKPFLQEAKSMFDNLATYYYDNVVTALVDCWHTSNDGVAGRSRAIRRAVVAASALFQLREHLPKPLPDRRQVEQLCPDYALLGDVVNATKHNVINVKTPHGAPLVTHATSLAERLALIEYNDSAGQYRHCSKTVVVKLADGSERKLIEVVTHVINHWETHLHTLGILPSARSFTYKDPNRFRLRADCNSGRLDLETVQSQMLFHSMRLLRFNETTGKAEPIDLTGAKLRGSIYQPSYEFVASLKQDALGREFTKTVLLTERESIDLDVLSTDAEREAFALSTQTAMIALEELAVLARLQSSDEST